MPARLDRKVYRGDTKIFEVSLWSNRYRAMPFDLAGATMLAQVRAAAGSAVLGTLACTILPAVAPAIYQNRLRFELTAALSATFAGPSVVFDVQATMTDGRVYTVVTGTWEIEQDVSRTP